MCVCVCVSVSVSVCMRVFVCVFGISGDSYSLKAPGGNHPRASNAMHSCTSVVSPQDLEEAMKNNAS